MRIGELAARTGVSVRSLRYYEAQGLLTPQRTAAGQRVYGPHHESVVATIRDLLAAGFCSSVIGVLLPALSNPVASTDPLPVDVAPVLACEGGSGGSRVGAAVAGASGARDGGGARVGASGRRWDRSSELEDGSCTCTGALVGSGT